MSNSQDEHALAALLRAAKQASKPISEQLLKDLYLIQREHQFEEDRAGVLEQLQQRIIGEIEEGSNKPDLG